MHSFYLAPKIYSQSPDFTNLIALLSLSTWASPTQFSTFSCPTYLLHLLLVQFKPEFLGFAFGNVINTLTANCPSNSTQYYCLNSLKASIIWQAIIFNLYVYYFLLTHYDHFLHYHICAFYHH